MNKDLRSCKKLYLLLKVGAKQQEMKEHGGKKSGACHGV